MHFVVVGCVTDYFVTQLKVFCMANNQYLHLFSAFFLDVWA